MKDLSKEEFGCYYIFSLCFSFVDEMIYYLYISHITQCLFHCGNDWQIENLI